MNNLKKILSIVAAALFAVGLTLSFQNCGSNYRFSSSESSSDMDNASLASREPSSHDHDAGSGNSSSSSTTNTTDDGVLLCNGRPCQAASVPPPSSAPTAPPNTTAGQNSSSGSLPFNHLEKIPINSGAFFSLGASPLVSSNQITLQSLPPEGALISIVDDPRISEESNTCQFAFNINNESDFYCHVKKDRKVYNGDKLRFVHMPSRYWSKKMIVIYQIGSVYSGEWSVETMADPGTKAILSGSFGFGTTQAQINKTIYSNTVTIKGLAASVRAVPIQVSGLQEGFELSINGQWIVSSGQSPAYGVWIKNDDQLQLRIIPRQLDTIYRAKILFEKIGLRNGTVNYTQSDYIDWSIHVDKGVSSEPATSYCEAGAVNDMPSIDGTQICHFSWQAAEVGRPAAVTVRGDNARLDATCTENGKLWTYNFHCPGKVKKSCPGGLIANIASKSKANSFCIFSWGMTEVGKAAGISDSSSNEGKASNWICKDDGTYSVGSFECP